MKIIVLGSTCVGKTTLIQALREQEIQQHKTQMVSYMDEFIDVPGEYLDIPRLHRAIIVTVMDAQVILLVQSAGSAKQDIPPGFAAMFNQPVIGVVSKIDLPEANIQRGKSFLRLAGVKGEIIPISALTGEGLDNLAAALEKYGWRRKIVKGGGREENNCS